MHDNGLGAGVKLSSVVRRVPPLHTFRLFAAPGLEGCVCAFTLTPKSSPIVLEAVSGRAMTLAPGDMFIGTPGHRESTRWVVGGIPAGGLVPGRKYWVLADCGVVGDLVGDSPLEKRHLGQVKYLGAVTNDGRTPLNIRQFAARLGAGARDHGTPVFLILGTAAEVGKTTAGVAVLRALRHKGHANVTVLKATGTSSLSELSLYLDFGAAKAFDSVDFGLPTTYPSDRQGVYDIFETALDTCLSTPADAVVIECGGDILGANVPVFLDCLKRRRSDPKIILAASDALAALGAKQLLNQVMGLSLNMITGPCTDTPTLRERTQALCETPAMNVARGEVQKVLF